MRFRKILLILLTMIFVSCSFETKIIIDAEYDDSVSKTAAWTYIVYMSADNDLDFYGVEDLNEMEAAEFDRDKMNLLVLFDRSNVYSADKSWSSTRLYEVRKDKNGMNKKIISKQLVCPELNLEDEKGTETELNMSDGKNLTALIKFAKAKYPAEHYALIIWGHGTGYRNINRAVAVDDTSKDFMQMPDLRKSLEDSECRFDLICFDTCFANEIEILYELKDCGKYFCGVPGLQNSSGFDYMKWLHKDISECQDGKTVALKLKESLENKTSVSVVDLTGVDILVQTLMQYFAASASSIDSREKALMLRKDIMKYVQKYRTYNATNNPVYINLFDLCKLFFDECPISEQSFEHLKNCFENLIAEESNLEKNQEEFNIGVYFCNINGISESETDFEKNIILPYSPWYINGSGVSNQCKFVKEIKSYVCTENIGGSLLDKLFLDFDFK